MALSVTLATSVAFAVQFVTKHAAKFAKIVRKRYGIEAIEIYHGNQWTWRHMLSVCSPVVRALA